MIAALQMYDWPEFHARTDAFWTRVAAALRQQNIDAPAMLSRPGSITAPWLNPDLLLGQTCGLPYVSGRCGDSVLVGRPVYQTEGAGQGRYASALVCRIDDPAHGLSGFRGRIAAVNEFGSQSGCNALADAVMDVHPNGAVPFFHSVQISGAHRSSAKMVAKGQADIAAIDAVAWALFAEAEPKAHARLRVLSWTRSMPALPFITSSHFADRVPDLLSALASISSDSNVVPLPVAVLPCTDSDYDPIREMAARVRHLKLAINAPEL